MFLVAAVFASAAVLLAYTRQRYGSEMRVRKSPEGLTSVIDSVSPFALIPEM